MQILLPLDPSESSNVAPAGFRLQRFEVLNWGTFDRQPWVLDLGGEIALLTGGNGSGKSTLVDGLLTLLVPNKRRNYNQASSGSGKKERDEKSYIQGAYGRVRVEDSYGSKPKFLREKGQPSILLAYFSDRLTKQDVTLTQVLWMDNGSAKKFFAIADAELSIAHDFSRFEHIADLKKQLKTKGVQIFEQFIDYSQQFSKRFGLTSDKALDLFNQTVSIKEIGGLNEFVRNHMLEKTDVQTRIQELQESYENLTISHAAIQTARKQLEALHPLAEEAEKYTKLQENIAVLQQLQSLAPKYFATKKLNILVRELEQIARQLEQLQQQKSEKEQQIATLRQKEKDLDYAIKQDSVGLRLKELSQEIEILKKEVDRKRGSADNYNSLAKKLGFVESEDRDTFHIARDNGTALDREIDTKLQRLEQNRDDLKLRLADTEKQKVELEAELTSLRSRTSQIPKSNLDIRDDLTRALNLEKTALPFVGELLQVKAEARVWEGAIERLLRGFGLSLLVPDVHYSAVNSYVNRKHLGGRLDYLRVINIAVNPSQRALDPQRVPYRLDIKQDNLLFSRWLQEQLIKQFNYVCCDLDCYQQEQRAITQAGLIKHGGERNTKDDRFRIEDRRQYILGWDNANKIKVLESELKQVKGEIAKIKEEINLLEQDRDRQAQRKSWLRDFMNFTEFTEIDWRSVRQDLSKLESDKQALEASSDRLRQLKVQLEEAQAEINEAEQQKEKSIGNIRTLSDRQQSYTKELNKCKELSHNVDELEIESFQKSISAKLRQYSMTLETINDDERDLSNYLQEKVRKGEKQQSDSQIAIARIMSSFKHNFSESTVELGTSLNYLDEYLSIKSKIELDDLPRHEQRFKQLMDENIAGTISVFKSNLERQEEEIQQSITELNNSLQKIDYTDSTYIHICCDKTTNREIRDFKEDLKICLADFIRPSEEDNEKLFTDIRTRLIERFKSEERWTNLVTDVRNWLDFSVSERYRSNNSEKEHHTDSSGKSGGQKVKLAYTILASAIAYQFGLDRDDSKQKSFRLVVIDEAFSKSDDSNARYAMDLFKNLDLQLLVITPKDKINVVESYLSSLHLVNNTPEGNFSSIVSMTIEDYHRNRQAILNHARSRSNSPEVQAEIS
jgi:uncharacterized protein YPO0396